MITAPQQESVILAGEPLTNFREGLTGAWAIELLHDAGGRLLIQLPVGVGKTRWLIATIVHALAADLFDLVVVLAPSWDILTELQTNLPSDLQPVVLRPRPRARCGSLDEEWQQYERAACGFLGRLNLCANCRRRKGCTWPRQYGAQLRGSRLILATQQHLVLDSNFVGRLIQQVRAKRTLFLFDESDLLLKSAERTLSCTQIQQFIEAQENLTADTKAAETWLNMTRLFAGASTTDLRDGCWRFPFVSPPWAVEVQQQGWERFGSRFRFIGYELQHFGRSNIASRERLLQGDVRFSAIPYLGSRFIIYSGSIARGLARYRLDPDHKNPALESPFEGYRFIHPKTSWININNLAGSARYFSSNAPRLMDFFAAKIARNVATGKRTLLVSRKRFIKTCRDLLLERLQSLGVQSASIVTDDWSRHDLNDPRMIPMINYGIAGVNRFERHEAAYCLNSYYVQPNAIAHTVQELEASGGRYPVCIVMAGRPARRFTRVESPDAQGTIIPWLAEQVLVQKEADLIVQAVGRVRPFTQPREIITFHAGELPGVEFNYEFLSLDQARNFFGIQTPSLLARLTRADQARNLRAAGQTIAKIAGVLAVSESTVKRDLREERVI